MEEDAASSGSIGFTDSLNIKTDCLNIRNH